MTSVGEAPAFDAYVTQVEAGFGANLPDGMKRIAAAIIAAEAATRGYDSGYV